MYMYMYDTHMQTLVHLNTHKHVQTFIVFMMCTYVGVGVWVLVYAHVSSCITLYIDDAHKHMRI